MAAALDSAFQKGAAAQTSPFAFASNAGDVTGTVGGSNRVLIAAVAFDQAAISAVAVTWNGVAMTSIGTITTPAGRNIFIFGLIAPATGNQTISASWTGGASDISLGAVSIKDADQATGWQNFTTNTGTSTLATDAVTSASGNLVVVGRADDNASSATIAAGTQDWDERDLNGNYGGGHIASVGASATVTWTLGSSVGWAMAGVDVIAFAAGATVALEWKQPTSQPTTHFTPTITSFLRGMPNPIPYLTTTPTAVTGTLDWIAPSVDIVWT